MYEKGLFGNKLKTWDDISKVVDGTEKVNTSVTMRYNFQGGKCVYNVQPEQIRTVLLREFGFAPSCVKLNESAPDEHLIFQGELQRTSEGLYLLYSTMKDKMRVALSKDPHHLCGLNVLNMLKANMTPSSYDDIIELLDEYPDHVIEFSTYDIELGNCKGRNTIVWECRSY